MYTIYEVPGDKIGCTVDFLRRKHELRKKGKARILEVHTDIYEASEREVTLQKEYGYRVDKNPYWYVVLVQVPKAHQPESIAKVAKATSKRQKGKIRKHLYTPEVIAKRAKKRSKAMKGTISDELLESCNKRKKKVYQYTKTGELINTFDSLSETLKIFNSKSISHCIHGRTKTALGYIWTY